MLDIAGEAGNFRVKLLQHPRYIDVDKCTGCGECAEACPVQLEDPYNESLSNRKAVFKLYAQAIPGTYCIQKADKAPCRQACPCGINVQAYVQLIKVGKYQEALNIIADKLPLPGVIGRICPHPCEQVCRRREIDESVSIRALKRFAADNAELDNIPVEPIKKGEPQVAIIGSGPAGLSCAYHLIKKGIRSVIFEAMPEPGGMLRFGIPDHRLPKTILKKEINYIQNLGVKIKVNTYVKDINFLFDQGYKAVYIAVGTHKGMNLGIEGEDAKGVVQGIEFLRKVNSHEKIEIGQRVAVIGGGNVAIDAARAAIRLGAEEVNILYRRTRQEMPALKEEVDAAEEEGVKIIYLIAPKRIIKENNKIKAIECIKMQLGEPDASGRRRPIPIPGTEHEIPVDQLILAIGQRPDKELLSSFGLDLNPNGTVKVDPVTYETNIKGVFCGGDVQTGPDIAIRAVAAGMEAAESIRRFIQGEDLRINREIKYQGDKFRPIPEDIEKIKRRPIPEIPLVERKKGFKEVELVYSEQEAKSEASRCLNCGYCCECFQCVQVCKANAINHYEQEKIIEISTGAIIFSAGNKAFDPKKIGNLYPRCPNILTSLEFERILSASGPTLGRLLRPSDNKEPKKIAWIQCVGSRDIRYHPYCSSVCCMYAIKEAVIAKEHATGSLDCAIFFMDMRTYGKDYERYYERAKEEGVRFIRCRIHTIEVDPVTQNLMLRYSDNNGNIKIESFDIVVLSIGFEVTDDNIRIANKIGIHLTENNFFDTNTFFPVSTSKKGIYVCGTLANPKDIPTSVMESSATSCEAGILLNESRGTLVKQKEFPEEINVIGERPRIGVFICHCGINIGGVININALKEYAKKLPFVEYVEDNLYTCSQDTQDRISEVIKEQRLNRIVVAACTPKTHEPLFQETLINAGLNKYLFEMVNIRNQDSWVHRDYPEEATEKAKDLLKMAVAKVALMEPLKEAELGVNKNVLIIGGGIAGMTAAKSISAQGHKVYLIEKSSCLGGNALNIFRTWKNEDVRIQLSKLIEDIYKDKNIKVYTNSEIKDVDGFVGNFKTKIVYNGQEEFIEHGAVIIATGAKEYRPKEYLYGQDSRVITSLELDLKLIKNDPLLQEIKNVVFIQCVGSREPERPYCSKVCCTHSIRNALYLKELNPDLNIYILYRDIRTYGEREKLYLEARRKGIFFIRYYLNNKPNVKLKNGHLIVMVQDHIIKRDIIIPSDLLVLASAIVSYKDERLAQLFKVPLNEDGFFVESHPKLAPSEFATDGVYLCGMAHYPKPIDEAITQAKAASSRAMTLLTKDKVLSEGNIAEVNPVLCAGCGVCVNVCPYGAPYIIEEGRFIGKASINPVLCKGCGLCVASCRSGAINLNGFRTEQIISMINELGVWS